MDFGHEYSVGSLADCIANSGLNLKTDFVIDDMPKHSVFEKIHGLEKILTMKQAHEAKWKGQSGMLSHKELMTEAD